MQKAFDQIITFFPPELRQRLLALDEESRAPT